MGGPRVIHGPQVRNERLGKVALIFFFLPISFCVYVSYLLMGTCEIRVQKSTVPGAYCRKISFADG